MKYYIIKKPGKFTIIFLGILIALYLLSIFFYQIENQIFNFVFQVIYFPAIVIYQFMSSRKYYISFDEKSIKFRLYRIKERTIQLSEIKQIDVKLFEIIILLKNDEEISIDLNQTDDNTLKKIKNKFNLINETVLPLEFSNNIQANN
ncbi:MAG: hypothetical protein ACON4M_01510 [Crocinitomicaceae bacterium]